MQLKMVRVGKDLVITSKKLKLRISHGNFCQSKKKVLRKLPVLKTGRTDPGATGMDRLLLCCMKAARSTV